MQNEPADTTPTDVVDAPVAESQDQAPSQEPAEQADPSVTLQTNDSDDADDSDWDSFVDPAAQQVQNVQPNEDGYIDPIQYKEQIKAEVREDMRFQERERRAWQKLEEKYPELKNDKEARQLILAKRIFDVQNGGNGSLAAAGKSVMGKITGAKQAGRADAQVSIKTQQNAGLSRATAPRDTSSSDTRSRLQSGDQGAVHDVLKEWLDQGKI